MKDLIFCQYCKQWVEYTHACTYQVSLEKKYKIIGADKSSPAVGFNVTRMSALTGQPHGGDTFVTPAEGFTVNSMMRQIYEDTADWTAQNQTGESAKWRSE